MLRDAREKRGYFLLNLLAVDSTAPAKAKDSDDSEDRNDRDCRHKGDQTAWLGGTCIGNGVTLGS
jgi:hypothetical protein